MNNKAVAFLLLIVLLAADAVTGMASITKPTATGATTTHFHTLPRCSMIVQSLDYSASNVTSTTLVTIATCGITFPAGVPATVLTIFNFATDGGLANGTQETGYPRKVCGVNPGPTFDCFTIQLCDTTILSCNSYPNYRSHEFGPWAWFTNLPCKLGVPTGTCTTGLHTYAIKMSVTNSSDPFVSDYIEGFVEAPFTSSPVAGT